MDLVKWLCLAVLAVLWVCSPLLASAPAGFPASIDMTGSVSPADSYTGVGYGGAYHMVWTEPLPMFGINSLGYMGTAPDGSIMVGFLGPDATRVDFALLDPATVSVGDLGSWTPDSGGSFSLSDGWNAVVPEPASAGGVSSFFLLWLRSRPSKSVSR